MGTQSHRSSADVATQKLEDRNKNIVPNKRARTPMGDMRVCNHYSSLDLDTWRFFFLNCLFFIAVEFFGLPWFLLHSCCLKS